MAKFPEPPSAKRLAATLGPDSRVLASGTRLWRIYFRAGPHPTLWSGFRAFGPTSARFDHHLPNAHGDPCIQDRRILYAARSGPTCLAEVFQDTRVIDRQARAACLAAFSLVRKIELLDLSGSWPTRAGASMRINSGQRPRARRWSQVFYSAYPGIEGLYYPSSMHGNRPCIALYERAEDALPDRPDFNRTLADPALLGLLKNAAVGLGYGLV